MNTKVNLKRDLSLLDLIVYGIILIQPVAALPLFGHANNISKGHAVTTILIAMLAMVFTALSYGRMANKYPSAGSAYSYVGKALGLKFGFITGWLMLMDYLFIPAFCIIFTSVTSYRMFGDIPFQVWIVFFAALFSVINLNNVKSTSRANWAMLVIMSIVVLVFMGAAIKYIVSSSGMAGLFSVKPFFNPPTFEPSSIASATALAALTYIGFDGLTTLAEEVKNPRRNVMLAAIITCVITGLWSGSQIYLAQLASPDWNTITQGLTNEREINHALDTAIIDVANRVGGNGLDAALSFILLLGSIGSGSAGQLGASRLLYGMGRDGVVPPRIFAHLSRRNSVPSYNVLIIGVLGLAGALLLNLEEAARLINFGAFFAFMGVNFAAMREYYFRSNNRGLKEITRYLLPSLFGLIFCFIIWINLPLKTFIIGLGWMFLGIVYLIIKTNWFRKELPVVHFSDTEITEN